MAAGIFGGAIQAGVSKALQEDQQKFQTNFYKMRYQRQMEDMRRAGLNPILSYQTGVPGGTAGGGIGSSAGIAQAIAQSFETPSKIKKQKSGQDLDVANARLQHANAKLAELRLPAAEATAAYDLANPQSIQHMRAAEIRQTTGDRPVDQILGGGIDRLQRIVPAVQDYFKSRMGIVEGTANKVHDFFRRRGGADYWKRQQKKK